MKITSYYGNTPSSQKNATRIDSNGISIFYSYETIIAIAINGKLTISKNEWGTTKGIHLNAIDRNKDIRVDYSEIQDLVKKLKITID
jgi:hypothetical protein